ncbi:MAG: IS91 family transposase [Candidatus Marsarchaeota archaeon]|jgi:hypothetical protein|nr:IS91 family transposase [Candidatus Marsarchaeota archaeon]
MPDPLDPFQEAVRERTKYEVADIFRHYGERYRSDHPLPPSHLKVMHDIEVCRTAYLGGHLDQCDCCGFQRCSYNSCRNRHCPKCQTLTKARWIEARKAELLPVAYFHNVFTLPHELNPLALRNKKVILQLLFKAVSETLMQFGSNPDDGLGGKVGFTCILHTWDQTLLDHFHLHCLIAGGALSFDGERWISAHEGFLFPVKALSKVFRAKFIHLLEQAYAKGEIILHGATRHLANRKGFSRLLKKLWEKDWIVYSKKPFAGPQQVLDYLGRYTHRVAISNNRIIDIDNGRVAFTYKDRKDNDSRKLMTLEADEFIRRFLLHILPDRFMRIRHFGFLANRSKKQNLSLCRQLLGLSPEIPKPPVKTVCELMLELTGSDPTKCPQCARGTMIVIRTFPELQAPEFNHLPRVYDSS